MQQGKLPLGFAVKMKQWTYVVYEDKLIQWINGTETERIENIHICVPKGKKQAIAEVAKSQGESINGYVEKALRGQIKQDTGNDIEL